MQATSPHQDSTPSDHRTATALWNPDAAAIWSLVFTPLFGATLHMLNWQALGEPVLAARARRWVWASLAMLLFNLGADAIDARMNIEPVLVRISTLGFLLLWYLGAARAQAAAVRARFGAAYLRRQWNAVLLAAVLAGTVYLAVKTLAVFAFVQLT